MANPFAQKVRQRKVVYFALILVLFSAALMHRKWWIEEEATRLKLREIAKGEVELTTSAVRLTLTGSRGMAVTFLWSAALRAKERHEWNELELLIGAVTKLQPYFITPWLFQGWNLAYNVSVECDRPHDKYYYVSRGLNLLAEGERRNHEQSIDINEKDRDIGGQPDLRHFIGVAYQGKFGVSDEKITMRSLFDLSCIDPIRRDPARFWAIGPDNRKTVNLELLAKFCQDYPRLVRRLREHLGYTDPQRIVAFLEDNQTVPSRFESPAAGADQRETPLKKDFRQQFPVMPPHRDPGPNPNATDYGLTNESMDIYVASRAWFDYAQLPVPPPSPDPIQETRFDRLKYRVPKAPAMPIYRGFPARAQMYSAEVMQEEGWFDADGWLIRDWFDRERLSADGDFRVGTEPKYQAGPAWERAYQRFMTLGVETGQYLSPGDAADLEQKAKYYREAFNISPVEFGTMMLPAKYRDDKRMSESWKAHLRLVYRGSTSRMTNFDGLMSQCDAERTVDQITARKLFYQAERLRRFENPEQALGYFDAAWPLWLGTCARYPRFAEHSGNQEDAYELQLKHLRTMQLQYPVLFRSLATGFAQMSVWPHAPLEELIDPSDKSRVYRFRNVRGLMDAARIYDVAQRDEISRYLLAWTQAAGTPRLFLFPGQENWMLMTFGSRDRELAPGWKHVIEDIAIQVVRGRYGLTPTVTPPMPPPGAPNLSEMKAPRAQP